MDLTPVAGKVHLRLDTFEGATGMGESGLAAIAPGHPGKSEVIRLIMNRP